MRRAYNSFLLGLFLLLVICPFSAQAAMLGFVTEDVSETDKAAVLNRMDLDTVQDDSYRAGIQCFAVDQNGRYALAVGKGSNCRIYVYDQKGMFLYGYAFTSDGDYGIEFHQDNLGIYFVRGNTIAIFDDSGICTEIYQALDIVSNYSRAKEILNRTHKSMHGREYRLERDMDIGDAYERFVVVDDQGVRTVLMDTSNEHGAAQSFLLVVPACFFVLVTWGVYKKRRK